MIKNIKQYTASKKSLKILEKACELSEKTKTKMPKKIYLSMLAGIESQIDEVKTNIKKWEKKTKVKNKESDYLMVKCPVCKGDKTVYTPIDDLTKNPPTKTGVDLTCYECDGVGEVTAKHLQEYQTNLD